MANPSDGILKPSYYERYLFARRVKDRIIKSVRLMESAVGTEYCRAGVGPRKCLCVRRKVPPLSPLKGARRSHERLEALLSRPFD